MARQRSGSSSARNTRGPGGARPSATRPAAKSSAKTPVEPAVDEPVADERAVDEPAATPIAADAPVDIAKPAAAQPVDVPTVGAPAAEEPDAVARPDQDDAGPDQDDDEPADNEVVAADDEAEQEEEDDEADDEPEAAERSATTAALWSDVRIAPIEIALPKGDGYTLRAYRMSNELAEVEVDEREDEFAGYLGSRAAGDDDALADDDEALAAMGLETEPAGLRKRRDDDLDVDRDDDDLDVHDDDLDAADDDHDLDEDEEDEDDDDPAAEADDDEDEEDEEDEEEDEEATPEEVPVFLGRRGKLYLFTSPEALVEFVRTSDEHDLAQLDTWSELRERLTPADIVPEPQDRYELDLVVDNIRGGADALDLSLLIQAGEVARDIAYATRLEPVISALSPGSPLDDLDEAVRAVDNGGFRAFLARRKLRRIVTQQSALGWRTIIGKISAVVDWRN